MNYGPHRRKKLLENKAKLEAMSGKDRTLLEEKLIKEADEETKASEAPTEPAKSEEGESQKSETGSGSSESEEKKDEIKNQHNHGKNNASRRR